MQTLEEKYRITAPKGQLYRFSIELTNDAIRKTIDDYNQETGDGVNFEYIEFALGDFYPIRAIPIMVYPDKRVFAIYSEFQHYADEAFLEILSIGGEGVRKVEV